MSKKCEHTNGPRGISGQIFTRWTCLICGDESDHHNTAIPCICEECVKLLGRCPFCQPGTIKAEVERLRVAVADALDTIAMHGLPASADVGSFMLLDRVEFEQWQKRARAVLEKEKP